MDQSGAHPGRLVAARRLLAEPGESHVAWPQDASLVLLSGGRSRRLGRDKATTHVGGRTILARIVAEVPDRVAVVLAGPRSDGLPDRVRNVREDPPGSGPLAGIGAALDEVRTQWVGVLAADMPFAVPLVARALAVLGASDQGRTEAVIPTDPGGHRQPLAAAYRTEQLREALGALAPLAGRPVRAVFEHLRVMEWPVPAANLLDVDTTSDLGAARRRAAHEIALEGAEMEQWVAAVQEALGLSVEFDIDVILDVARDAARAVERPAAPVTAFLLGVAVARGASADSAARTISELASKWDGARP